MILLDAKGIGLHFIGVRYKMGHLEKHHHEVSLCPAVTKSATVRLVIIPPGLAFLSKPSWAILVTKPLFGHVILVH